MKFKPGDLCISKGDVPSDRDGLVEFIQWTGMSKEIDWVWIQVLNGGKHHGERRWIWSDKLTLYENTK